MNFTNIIFALTFSVASATASLKGTPPTATVQRKLFADPAGPAQFNTGRQDAVDPIQVTLDLLEATYDGFCNLCAIAGILNADQIYCILCNFDLDGDDVNGQDPDVIDIPTCFSEIATVHVEGLGIVAMKDLQVGAQVLTQSGTYEPVYAFGHKNPTKSAEFLQFQTAESSLEMTGGHLVFLEGKTNPVRADSIKVGDVLQGDNDGEVQKISTVKRDGVYSPLTPSGTVVVDGIVASTYISLQKDANEFVEFQGGFSSYLSFQDFIHMTLSPFRMFCMGISSSLGNTYTEDGIPLYAAYGMEFAKWADNQNILVQLFLFLVVGTLAGASMFVEDTFGGASTAGPLALLVTVSYFVVMMTTKNNGIGLFGSLSSSKQVKSA